MIENFKAIQTLITDDFGIEKRDECLSLIEDAIGVKVHSLKTNYLTGRSYSEYKLKEAISISQKFYRELFEQKKLQES